MNVDVKGVCIHRCDEVESSAVLGDPDASLFAGEDSHGHPLMDNVENTIKTGS